ncbi:hypothetical protein A3K34_02160 [candidate division WWE3 bacterium RIFOXYC1_FULL_40_10]|uniref:Uncharacterized protein n=1 Tax=candidate division WWE3 bacterium RIFOXYA2_FULL_46_9 TaxID=1802636 RepID=A0A1F4W2K7_UNCKA|nr:MAG: hypothetical protein A3K58_02160 [candidate division WWE3 bacterium RIFOXYB1_FULL_40_22]OGC61657.1 MAG: hypothetical protein A3K37_02160 [candidate division WWE3 bacterium RIFOXYA1_FULL_40_11]OGC63283.1 MAG: hypothetical protein A2264_02780 [candidate division WWE3 bacterium RIFOXYA2_FULL_46_9]OGC64414.1 MAG: hypothetical protein A2326_02615 [candidate division WWE3 bacterium RIFOXYB2_FULL_41_6]OGC66040.1 MAG: hypothetical protein A3K34_02160 [candidate division WWE3 bacterium RIFOXYC1_
MLRVRDAAQTFICTDPSQYSAFVLSFDTEAEHINGEKRFLAGGSIIITADRLSADSGKTLIFVYMCDDDFYENCFFLVDTEQFIRSPKEDYPLDNDTREMLHKRIAKRATGLIED